MADIIRFVSPRDARAVCGIYSHYVTQTSVTLEYEAPDEVEMERRIAHISPAYPWIVCESGGRILGYSYASSYHERAGYQWNATLSVYTAPGCGGRGMGRALYECVLRLLFEQGYYHAHAVITMPNERSIGLHEALGFERRALYTASAYKLGRWLDVAHYCRTLREPSSAPRATIPVSRLESGLAAGIISSCAVKIKP